MATLWIWRVNRRRERPPVSEKLLRGPGEGLRRRLERLDDYFLIGLAACSIVPGLLLWGGLVLSGHIKSTAWGETVFISAIVLFVAALAGAGWWLMRTLTLRRDCHLGLYGEKAVAEALVPLMTEGYQIFHDVPCEYGDIKFDIDHIVIGPSGVYCVETKTRRKGKAIGGRKDHEIIFDGEQLVYPWGEDTHGLAQARKQAEWLAQWIYQIIGERMLVTPVLVFPGWWVSTTTLRDLKVLNPKQLGATIHSNAPPVLTPKQIELVTRQLDARCRDVEF
ncbi:MAG TPA: nuclease-related domain-containing protein [Opitutaceae bacterium]|nr:nuclease-related domain-containing protein [Opitutaceae bacterium]